MQVKLKSEPLLQAEVLTSNNKSKSCKKMQFMCVINECFEQLFNAISAAQTQFQTVTEQKLFSLHKKFLLADMP